MSHIRVRFAPSPTGHLHIGGVRTALFNYLYARAQGGQFLLRMEDTDCQRSTEEFAREILESMKWLGLEWDGEIEYQSRRLQRYRACAEQLMGEEKAYRADRNTQAVFFKMPKDTIVFHDIVKEAITFDTALFDDLVILKSDGFPTYNFACVVDDHDSGVSHVIRGEDHISNTPRQIALFRALGWEAPKYAHLPLIMGRDGAPLSKRHGAVSLAAYKENGFLPAGIINYLALLGWGPGGNQEFFTKEELIKKFSLKRVNAGAAVFDTDKMRYLNALHLKKLPANEYIRLGKEYFSSHPESAAQISSAELERILLLYKDRIKTWNDVFREADYCFCEPIRFSPEAVKKYLDSPGAAQRLQAVIHALTNLSPADFKTAKLEKGLRDVAAAMKLEAAGLIHPVRVALTGVAVSPGLFELMELLGREKVMKRLEFAADNLSNLPMKES